MNILLGMLFVGALAFAYRYWIRDYRYCPECGAKTMEAGYDGWRLKCSRCDWNNYHRDEVLDDDFLDNMKK